MKNKKSISTCPLQPKKRSIAVKLLLLLIKIIALVLCFVITVSCITVCVTGVDVMKEVLQKRYPDRFSEVYSTIVDKCDTLYDKIVKGKTTTTKEEYKAILQDGITAVQKNQDEIDVQLLAELREGGYTCEEPLIVNDPYGVSPLTAMALFTTEKPAQISVSVAGDTKLAEVSYDVKGYSTEHTVPIYGLYAGRINAVTLTVKDQSGTTATYDLEVEADVLPNSLTHETVTTHLLNESAYEPGFNFTYLGNHSDDVKSAFDVNGDYRWVLNMNSWGTLSGRFGYAAEYNGTDSVYLVCGGHEYGPVMIIEVNYLGKVLNTWYSEYGVHHDLTPTNEGTILATGSLTADILEDLVYEIDKSSGEIVNTLDYKQILQYKRDQVHSITDSSRGYPESYYTDEDPLHINTCTEYNDEIIISSRNQSSIVSTDRSGKINWILADPIGYDEYYRSLCLTPVGDNFKWFYVQHDVEVLPDLDNNADTLDIMLFDNGDFRPDVSERTSRVVHYRINEKERTVEQIFSYGDDRPELYSYIHGGAIMLQNGNYLGSFEPYNERLYVRNAYGIELKQDGSAVWEVRRESTDSENYGEYRLTRIAFDGTVSGDMHLGESANLYFGQN